MNTHWRYGARGNTWSKVDTDCRFSARQRLEALRCRSSDTVNQELWGLLLAYNLVRLEMERIADETGVAPRRISFVAALRLIINEWS